MELLHPGAKHHAIGSAVLERTQSVFGRSLVQVFKIADSKSFLKSKAIKTKKIRSTVVEGNYFRSKKNNSSSYHANFLS